jgi:hypothetical protein
VVVNGLLRRKVTPGKAIFGHRIPKQDLAAVRAIYDKVEGREQRYELNLFITGYDEEAPPAAAQAQAPPAVAEKEGAPAEAEVQSAPDAEEEGS